jgi:hypothetical protein
MDGGMGNLLGPPPSPPTSRVPQPSATVANPNLQVLPWAGFKAALTFTCDDSQPSQIQHWPELQAIGAPLTFFVEPSTNTQAGYDASWTAIAAAGSELGNHTWTHCPSGGGKPRDHDAVVPRGRTWSRNLSRPGRASGHGSDCFWNIAPAVATIFADA